MNRILKCLAIPAVLASCGLVGPDGERCGGEQSAVARVTLPDTGIGGGAPVMLVFTQRDPFLIGEQTDVTLWHLWPSSRGRNPAPDPRVRLVRADGVVLLDTLTDRTTLNQSQERDTWLAEWTLHDAARRNALFEAMRDQRLWLELWRRGATASGTRVKLATEEATVHPVGRCL